MRRRHFHHLLLFLLAAAAVVFAGHSDSSASCPFHDHGHGHEPEEHHGHGHSCGGANHEHEHSHDNHVHGQIQQRRLLPEELAEEADLELDAFGHRHHDHDHDHHNHDDGHGHGEFEASPLGVWVSAMGCSLLVSMASLVCLVLLPVIFVQGKPSKAVVDSLALFGAGAMLGDSFLHQLPHAFGGGHSHSHGHHDYHHGHEHSHAHSLEDLSVGLSILFGIVLFFVVEKIVRYVEDNSRKGTHSMGHGHHHHHHKRHDLSDKADLNNKGSDHEDKDIGRAEVKSLHDDTLGEVKNGNHLDSKATLRKECLKIS